MPVKEVKPWLDPASCSICGRRLLQGEQLNHFVAPDASARVVCELCVPRAERARWVRERDGEEVVQLRPSRGQRSGLMRRIGDFFGAGEPSEELDEFADPTIDSAQDQRRRKRSERRVERGATPAPAEPGPLSTLEARDIAAVPTEPEARLERGLELFNLSQFPRTIAGLSRSLGDPKVAVVNVAKTNAVDVWVGWDLAWYSYRVTLGDRTEPVEQSGRGNDVDELIGVVRDWNAGCDGFGRLFLREGSTSDQPEPQNAS